MTDRITYCVETVSWGIGTKFVEEVMADSPLDAAIEVLKEYGQPSGLQQIAVWIPGPIRNAARRRLDGDPPTIKKTARHQHQCVICHEHGTRHTARCALV